MRTKKNGEVAISRFVWDTQASTHEEMANELDEVIRKYRDSAELGVSGIEEGKIIVPETALAFYKLLSELHSIQLKHLKLALASKQLARDTSRGRPAAAAKYKQNKLMFLHTGMPLKIRRSRGRPSINGVNADLEAYKAVEHWRGKMPKHDRLPTIKAAIESIIDQIASERGQSFVVLRRKEFNKIRSQYNRGKKASEA